MKETDLYQFHDHDIIDCDCNLYGEYMLKEMSKHCPFKLPLFLLKFRLLYNQLNLKNSEINKNWKTSKECTSVPYELNKFNVVKFNHILKCFDSDSSFENCFDTDENLLYIPVQKEICRRVHMNYPQSQKKYFEYYIQDKDTLFPPKYIQNNIYQFNLVLSILDKLVQNKNVLNTVNFKELNQLAEQMSFAKIKYLDGLLNKTQSHNIVKDAAFLDLLYKNPKSFTECVQEFYLNTDIHHLQNQLEQLSIN
jgi:hypothetical protein